MKKIYLAGPDVFSPQAETLAGEHKALCQAMGFIPLHPIDQPTLAAEHIYRTNIALIGQADAVAANLNPFRGAEVDSGTAFEVGYALALGKPVVGYVARSMTVRDRVTAAKGPLVLDSRAGVWRDRDGNLVEDFGLAANLMLAVPCPIVVGDLGQALAALQARLNA